MKDKNGENLETLHTHTHGYLENLSSQKIENFLCGYEGAKRTKGITLIALVITIIIMLILAGVTIQALEGTGLFNKAKIAKEEELKEEAIENISFIIAQAQLEKVGEATINDVIKVLENDKNNTYIIKTTKTTALINESKSDIINSNQEVTGKIYVTNIAYGIEIEIANDLKYTVAKTQSIESSSTGNGSNNNELSGNLIYNYVKLIVESKGENYIKVKIDDTNVFGDEQKKYNYYLNDKLVYTGSEKEYEYENLTKDVLYKMYAIAEYEKSTFEISEIFTGENNFLMPQLSSNENTINGKKYKVSWSSELPRWLSWMVYF